MRLWNRKQLLKTKQISKIKLMNFTNIVMIRIFDFEYITVKKRESSHNTITVLVHSLQFWDIEKKNNDDINYMISDLERFILGLFTDDFRFVCVHISSVCEHNTIYKTIIQNHKKKKHIQYSMNFKTDQPKGHKFQWTQIITINCGIKRSPNDVLAHAINSYEFMIIIQNINLEFEPVETPPPYKSPKTSTRTFALLVCVVDATGVDKPSRSAELLLDCNIY
ncbi:hypothetical protein AGLY_003172 [Aphis glycines]|uniref:Uncharacterized protein n=1 Tax=Aphis glycines TaxID=307491 RepID=A0A6G0U2B9_APHGL|nr:hypothetical protein AGLY_003172 [Aphis glycines]